MVQRRRDTKVILLNNLLVSLLHVVVVPICSKNAQERCTKVHEGGTWGRMLQEDHELEETVCQLRHEFGNDFIAVDEEIAVAMDVLKLPLALETQQFEDTKALTEDHGSHGATTSAGRHVIFFAANFSMGIAKVELIENGQDGTKDSLVPGFHDELATCCLRQVSWMYWKCCRLFASQGLYSHRVIMHAVSRAN